ncbi:Mitochondrial transcription termination factor, mTERF [Handroanthus impetiginosus]|uniref:Mitochondrial transcription termination factor, mTERF n=1 Tax=Handroanthus impetiginosus TaxID=429701 RepID=A0A2G9HL99_9LAMI|nr:Mitochondrial transcription termination factor, mTERF [Handroanthus impetiginosus]
MAAPDLDCRHHSFSSYSFPSPYRPYVVKPHFLKSPKPSQNPSKTSISTSFSILGVSLQKSTRNCRKFLSALPSPDSEQEPHGKRLEEAREAIRVYLEKVGASAEDASHISLNCWNYLNMLIDGVDDLDDWNSWTAAASSGGEITGDALEFKKKVYQMAEQKGDNGILPFLESLGLSLSSATHLARYLSASESNALPLLVQKVKYVKEIFFPDGDDHELIGKNARRMMAHLSISADEDVQQTLAFFEKIQARRGGLSLLGSESTSFRCLIESFPHLLFLPLQSRVKPIVKFLEDIGVPKGNIRNIFLLFPPIVSYDIDRDIKPRLRSFQKIDAKDNDIRKMLVKYPWILSASVLGNFENVVDFFDEEKVPKIYSSRAIKKWPQILGCSVNKLKVMVGQFSDMGIKDKKLGHVIATSPQLLLLKPQEFVQVVSFFKDLGLNEEEVARTLGRCPEIFAASIDKTLERKLNFLSSVGITESHLPRVIRKYPELFVCDVDRALLPRMRYLMKIGLSKRDIASMVRRFSPLLGYSIEEVLRPKLEFLVNIMGRPVSEVVEYPRYFSYSLEKKIKPRYWVLKRRNIEFTLKEMLGKNDEEFAEVYLGVEDMLVPPS